MSDHELKPDSLDAGHRRKPEKAAKLKRAASKPKAQKRASIPGLSKVRAPLGRVLAAVTAVPGRIWKLWDRAYDDVAARPVRAVRILGVVVASIGVLAGLFWFQTDRWAQTDVARVEASDAGEAAVSRLLSYSFRSIDRQGEKTKDLVTGKFRDEYAEFLNTQVAPGAKDKQVVVRTGVDRSSVVDASPGEVVLLMYIQRQSEMKLSQSAESGVSGVRVTLEKEDGIWKVSELTPV